MSVIESQIRVQLSAITGLRRQRLMQSVLSYTSAVVYQAMQGNWSKVLDTVDQRRHVLELLLTDAAHHGDCIDALQSAVEESERAVARVVAHAIADARRPGATSAMFN